MFNAIAREVGNAASAVAEAVLPGKDGAEQGPSEGEDVHRKARDQDEPLTNDQSGTEEAKEADDDAQPSGGSPTGPVPVISGDSDTKSSRFDERAEAPLGDMPSATAAEAAAEQPPAQEQQESTEDAPSADADRVHKPTPITGTTNKDASRVLQAPVVDAEDNTSRQTDNDSSSKQQAHTAHTGAKQLTAGAAPLPKMTKGRAKWMKNRNAWYPDSMGVHRAPGVYINRRKPFRGWGEPPGYTDISVYLGVKEQDKQ